MPGVAGQVALVTGGARGIGRAIGLTLARAGADLAITYRGSRTQAEEVVAEARRLGRPAAAFQADVRDRRQVEGAIRSVEAEFGRLDILVNNAGVATYGPFVEGPPESWDEVIAVNLQGTLLCTYAALPGMVRRRYGRIVNISSEFGVAGAGGFAVYSAAKGAVIAFTKALAREVGPHGITVNAVAPGPIVTDMNRARYTPEEWQRRAERMPVGRVGEPQDVAHAVLFLASEEASFTTGQVLMPNGGEVI